MAGATGDGTGPDVPGTDGAGLDSTGADSTGADSAGHESTGAVGTGVHSAGHESTGVHSANSARLNSSGVDDTDLSVLCHLDRMLDQRDLTLSALAERVGITVVNLSVLKNNRAKAIRFTTLVALCRELDCTPGDLFSVG